MQQALVSILMGATGIISLLLSNPSILFEKIEDNKEIADLETYFTSYAVRNLRNDGVSEILCIEGMRDGYNLIIKIVGFLESTVEQYNRALLSFKRGGFTFGCFLLISAATWFVIGEYLPDARFLLSVAICMIGALLLAFIVNTSLSLRKTKKSYHEYMRILKQQKANVAFRKMSRGTT